MGLSQAYMYGNISWVFDVLFKTIIVLVAEPMPFFAPSLGRSKVLSLFNDADFLL